MSNQRLNKYNSMLADSWGKVEDRWQRQIRVETQMEKVVRQVDDNTFEELSYSMRRGKHRAGLFVIALDQTLRPLNRERLGIVSSELDAQKFEMDLAENLVDVKSKQTLDRQQFKQRFKISRIENALGAEIDPSGLGKLAAELGNVRVIPTVGVVSPSLRSLSDLNRYLEKSLHVMNDLAKDEGLIFSPIPVRSGDKLLTPYCLSSFDPFASADEEQQLISKNIMTDVRRERGSWNNLIQADRNSLCPEETNMCEDYVTYCNWHHGLESTLRWLRADRSYVSGMLGVREMNKVIEHESYRMGIASRYNMPLIFNTDTLAEETFGHFFSTARTYPCSLDEIVAINAVDAAVDARLVASRLNGNSHARNSLWFHQLAELQELRSRIYDEDPTLLSISNRAVEDVGIFVADFASQISLGLRQEKKLVDKLIADGYAEATTVSKYWPAFVRELKPYLDRMEMPDRSRQVIQSEMGFKYGTRKLRSLLDSNKYDELPQVAWENLCQNRSWIA